VIKIAPSAFQVRYSRMGRMVAVAGFLLIGFAIGHLADQAKIASLKEEHREALQRASRSLPRITGGEEITHPENKTYLDENGNAVTSPGASPTDILTNTNRLIVELSDTLANMRDRPVSGGAIDEERDSFPGMPGFNPGFASAAGGANGDFVSPFPIIEVEPVRFELPEGEASLPGEFRLNVPNLGAGNSSR
jgi:hypothetical protein